MVNFCSYCGERLEDETSKFCSKCGKSLDSTGNQTQQTVQSNTMFGQMNCPFCGKNIPITTPNCPFCGNVVNAKSYKVAIIIGYVGTLIIPLIGIIDGIYLLTRDNQEVHKHGIIMIMESIIMWFIWFISVLGLL